MVVPTELVLSNTHYFSSNPLRYAEHLRILSRNSRQDFYFHWRDENGPRVTVENCQPKIQSMR